MTNKNLSSLLSENGFERITGILTSSVRVNDQLTSRPPQIESALVRFTHKIGTESSTCSPTNNRTRTQIENNNQIQPTFLRPDVGDIRCPDGVRFCCYKLSLQSIRFISRDTGIFACRNLESSSYKCYKPVLKHQSGDSVLSTTDTLFAQIQPYPRASVSLFAFSEVIPNLYQQFGVRSFSMTWLTLQPVIVSTSGYFENTAHNVNMVFTSMLADKGILLHGRREKTPMAFFKMSRSSVTRSSSLLSCRSSSSWGESFPWPGKAPLPDLVCSITQRRSMLRSIPRSRAISGTGCWPSTTIRTASTLKDLSYVRRVLLSSIRTPPYCNIVSFLCVRKSGGSSRNTH